MRRGHQAAIEAAFQKASQASQGRNKGSEEDEKKITQNGHAVPVEMSVPVPVLQGGAHKQGHSQGQPAGPIVCWERFLPVKALRVLLVENDDCTRHVVSALLRNCSYEVITAANGIQAWKILIDLNNHIDLVLTEVVMPCISGIGLLGKIMSHKTRKNIPVIMMSSNDSMGTVFRCLSKGAVDFLVKPIRKNELKNLWQHIWRRCHSSSGSGSESAIRTQKGDKTNSGDDSEHNSRSTDNEENTSVGLNARDSSDNGSGTQMSSWTKCAVEVESPKAMSLSDQLVDPPDSTCAQVIHPKPELYCNTWLPITTNLPTPLPHKRSNDEFMGKDLEIGVPGNSKNSEKEKEAGGTVPAGGTMMMNIDDKTPNSGEKTEDVTHGSARFDEPSTQAADLIGSIAKTPTDAQLHTAIPNKIIYDGKDKELGTFTVLPSLELSLKRLRSVMDNGAGSSEDRKVLRRSEVSAFTRYHTSSAASNQAPTGGTGGYGWSCSPVDNNTTTNNNSSEAVKTDLANDPNLAKQGSNGSSNNNDMGSTTKNVFATRQAAPKDKVASPSAVKNNQHTSAFQPVQFRPASTATPPNPQVMEEEGMKADGQDLPRDKEFKVQHHHHHHHHYHHHHHSSQQQQQQEQQKEDEQQEEEEEKKEGTTVMESTGVTGAPAGTVYSNPVEGHAANYKSLNGSNSGSNGQNGASTAGHGGGGVNVENGNGMAEKNGAVNGNESGSGVYQNRAAQREAALNKFREKRKARNFGKKVRYQSRKRLAEQRPRVRGQFVRQNNNNNNNNININNNNNNGREGGER